MSAQNETWWEALLGLVGMNPYEPAAGPDCATFANRSGYDQEPCVRTPVSDDTDCDY